MHAPSHMNPVPHAAAPAAVTSVHGRKQKFPRTAWEQLVNSTQRPPVQSASLVHCFSQTLTVALYPMQFNPTAHSALLAQALPAATVPAWKHACCGGGPHDVR